MAFPRSRVAMAKLLRVSRIPPGEALEDPYAILTEDEIPLETEDSETLDQEH